MEEKSIRVFHFFLMIIVVIGLILIIQWKGYTTQQDQADSNVEQTISVRHTDESFEVKHVIRNLPDGKYSIQFPEGADERKCQYEDNGECEWETGKSSKLKINDKPVIFTYTLNTTPKASSFLLEDWGIKIKEVSKVTTRVRLTETIWRKGSWIAGSDLTGKEKMEAIDYYVFKSDDGLPALYWQDGDLVQINLNSHLTIYHNGKSKFNLSIFEKIVPAEKQFVIITDHTKSVAEKGKLIIFPDSKDAEDRLVRLLVEKKLSFEKGEEWLTELMISIMIGKPAENHKVEKMRKTITSLLTENQLERWLENVLSTGIKISTKQLDEWMGDAANIKTDFFQKNAVKNGPFHPFYYQDKRDVYIQGQKTHNIKIIVMNNRTYISFFPLINKLGFHVLNQTKMDEIKMEKEGNVYQFTFKEKLFTINGEQYGFKKNPFIVNQNEVYLDTAALSAMFGLSVDETNDQINIK